MGEIVRGSRRPQPILRKYRQPVFDSEKVGNGVAPTEISFFTTPRGQRDAAGVTKTERDCNIQAANQLGALQEFYLVGFTLKPDLRYQIQDVPIFEDPETGHLTDAIDTGGVTGDAVTCVTGGFGTGGAYDGGVVYNVTQDDYVGGLILSHTNTVLTMVSTPTGWLDADVLEIYTKYWGDSGAATNPVEVLKRIFADSYFNFTFGRQQPLLEIPTNEIPWGIGPQGAIFNRTGNLPPITNTSTLVTLGVPSVREFFDVRLRRARPRHVQPDMSFKAVIKWPRSPGVILETGKWARVMCYMVGILLSTL